ncbi:ABC transporter substrate-binding protein [Paenibacillus sp. B2(2019)]|uniref:ABC transporter substrate-binding protein n=1 Tax=Paenibacillus sp. B2(2019) TaxID=2607754 RepID=UPI0011F3661D|nr:ABC transporter substrate-binding protein [Paenibacillus sp. B2(2019)]KAA1189271.1 ABC transporter substrate-binding protein [Paenibacillus sp. B2(2019)]
MKRFSAILLSVTMLFTMMLTGCGQKEAGSTDDSATAPANEKLVELNFYMMNSPVNEFDRIMKKANEIIAKEINAKLNLILVDSSTYADKMNLMINSGDDWDLGFTASWGGINFFENAAKGAYADLTDLLPKYAPETYSRIPEGLWEGVKVKDRIYAVVNYQQWGTSKRSGFQFRKDLAEEMGFNWGAVKGKSTIEALEMIGPFLGDALKKHPEMIGFETSSIYSLFANDPLYWNMESVGDMSIPGWINLDNPDKVINQYETEDFAKFSGIMRDWFLKGYVRKDGATVKDTTPDRKAGKFVAEKTYGWPDSIDVPEQNLAMSMMPKDGTAPAVSVSTTRTMIPAGAGSTAAIAINSESKHIEKALELIELLNTNDDLYKLITLGEEGVDYKFNEDGAYTPVEGKYSFNWNEWQIGQSYSPTFNRAQYDKNKDGETQKEIQTFVYETDKTADISPVTGFVFDPTPIKTQLANCSAVITEMVPALSSGSVDPEKVLPDFLKRLKTAGVDDIIKEKQAQYDAWKANK